jgi:beta-glucosidase
LVLEPGTFKVMIGSSSKDIRLEGEFAVSGKNKSFIRDRVFVCPVEIG